MRLDCELLLFPFFGFIKLTNFNTSDLYMYKLLWLWKIKQLNSKAKPDFLSLSGQAAGTASLQTITKTSSGLQLSTGWWSSSVSGCCHFGGHSDMYTVTVTATLGAGIAQWLELRTRDWKVAGSNPCRSGGRIFFSGVNFLYWLLFRYPFHPRVTAVARKRCWLFCQKCRCQVTTKHACTLSIKFCMKWRGAWLSERAEMAAVPCGTSYARAVSTPLRWIFKNAL